MRFREGTVERYIRHLSRVKGWLNPFSAQVIVATSQWQRASGYRGAVAEIGVHHGKLFLALYLTTAHDEPALAIDVFGRQDLNVDASGHGDREIFLRHARRWSPRLDGLTVIGASSLEVTAQRIKAEVGPVRIFSIDVATPTRSP